MADARQVVAEIGEDNLERLEIVCCGVPQLEDLPESEVQGSRAAFEADLREEQQTLLPN